MNDAVFDRYMATGIAVVTVIMIIILAYARFRCGC